MGINLPSDAEKTGFASNLDDPKQARPTLAANVDKLNQLKDEIGSDRLQWPLAYEATGATAPAASW